MQNFCIISAGVLMSVLFAGCAHSGDNNEGNAGKNETITSFSSKAEIDEYIDKNWKDFGYKEKPDKYIAISFDDGPCDASAYGGTAAMLKTLETLKIKATFFVIGGNVRNNKSAAKAIFAAGHELGNHSDGYGSLGSSSIDAITASLNSTSNVIKEITGNKTNLFRAPNLNHGNNLSEVCENLGMALIDGSVHSDWPGSSPAIKNSVLANAQNGGILVLHDNNTSQGNTMKDLPEIVSELRARGFWIMTVSELALVKGKTLEAGKRYGVL